METILKTTNLTKKFGSKIAVNKVNMTIKRGEIYGFIGKNGAGKTTLMKMVLGLTCKTSGEIELFGEKDINKVGLKVGSLIEAPGLYRNATAHENMYRFSLIFGGKDSIDELLDLVGLTNVGKKKVKDFSLGMKQRLGIAISLLGNPELLILDEPINGLDPKGIKEVRDIILKLNKEKGITFLISSHLLDELSRIVTKYGIINDGVLVEEVDSCELINRCKNKLVIETNDINKTEEVLKEIINEEDMVINENELYITSHVEEGEKINKFLCEHNIYASSIYASQDSLEDYFIRRIGGYNE